MQTIFPEIILPLSGLDYDKMSDEEFFDYCKENRTGTRIERDNNRQIILMPPTGAQTERFNIKIATRLENWSEKAGIGVAFGSSGGFTLPDSSVFSPDAAWMGHDKWNALSAYEKERFPQVCPDFVVELKSPSDNSRHLMDKMQRWIENGVSLGWLINPNDTIVFIYRKDGTVSKVTGFDNKLSGEDVLPGFELDLSILK